MIDVERVARALWELETETDCHDFDALAQFRKNATYEKARAAIAAMRKPTEKMVCLELTENEAKAIANELWLRMHTAMIPSTGSYMMWLKSAYAKVHAALPAPAEFTDNH